MLISVEVKTCSSLNNVAKISENSHIVKTTAIPEKGKANKKVIELIAKELSISKSTIKIKTGTTAKLKILEIL